ncbi:MAG: hypothetical protein HOC74_02645 [Gemmatimonadetes bacterium]|nr:hypothetical protein [Gemmatimonadota bacterium]
MGERRFFKVLVYEGGEEPKVEVTVPLKLAKWALKILPVVKGEVEKHADLDFESLKELLEEGFNELEELEPLDLVKVNDGDTRVRIAIE